MMTPDTDLMTFSEAAAVARCSEATLRQRWRRYDLPRVGFGQRSVLIRRADLLAHLKTQSVQ